VINAAAQVGTFNNSNSYPQEKIYLHTNSNFFLTGESLVFKIYCLDEDSNLISSLSKVGYVELTDKENRSIYKQKIDLQKGIGTSSIFLSSTLKTATYKLISYTQWMRNKQTFFEENIFIVNPFSNKLTSTDSLKLTNYNTSFTKNSRLLNLSSDKKIYQKREKVVLNFNTNISENVSISVRKFDSIEIPDKINSLKFIANFKHSNTSSKKAYLPELRGSLFKGAIASNTNTDLFNKKIGLSFIGENKITKISLTDSLGVFYFNINKPFDANEVIIELLEEDNKNYTISLITDNDLEKKFDNFDELLLTENIRKIIKQRSLYTQIENGYNEVKLPTLKPVLKNEYVFQENENKVIYNLDEYERFKTIKEVAVEILQDVWIRKKKDNYTFNLRDVNLESNTELETLLIVDGFIVYNHSDFIYFDALKIKSIEIVKEKYHFGAKIYQGIINIETFKNQFKPSFPNKNKFTLLKESTPKSYFNPDYSIAEAKRIPDFRTQLYWNSDLNNDTISFYTSDISGTFEAIIEGFTKEGTVIYEKIVFTVK
jgi:hypothetical protein